MPLPYGIGRKANSCLRAMGLGSSRYSTAQIRMWSGSAARLRRCLPIRISPAACQQKVFIASSHRGYCGPTSTTLEGIRQVPPGTVMTFTSREETSQRFWQPKRQPDIRSLDEAVDGLLALWPQVVRDQLVSDVPVGILQSGGIDSTLVSLAANDSSGSPTPLFTAKFADQSFDEVPLAGLVADRLGAPFHPISVAAPGSLAEVLRRVVKVYDGQVADEASVPLYLLSAAVRQHVTVALCGDGGDEFFGGYPTYVASRAAAVLGRLFPRAVWQALGQASYARGAER